MRISDLSKVVVGIMISLSLSIYSPSVVFPQAPPNELVFPAQAPPSDIGGRLSPAPPLVFSPCTLTASDVTAEANNNTVNSSAMDNDSRDFGSNTYDSQFTLTTSLIAKDLSSLSPMEIKDYGLNALSTDELKSVLCMLTPGNLTKILMNIAAEDLINIRERLTPPIFENILDIRAWDNRTQIENRINNHTG